MILFKSCEAKRRGLNILIILTAGTNVIRLLPPLSITKTIGKGIEILTEII